MNRLRQRERSGLLRRALQANAVFSALSGITMIIASDPITVLIGFDRSVVPTGVFLLIFAAGLLWNSWRQIVSEGLAWLAVGLDAAWVAGTMSLIFAGVFNSTGNWIVAIVADIVLVFAVLQFAGLRRLRRAEEAA